MDIKTQIAEVKHSLRVRSTYVFRFQELCEEIMIHFDAFFQVQEQDWPDQRARVHKMSSGISPNYPSPKVRRNVLPQHRDQMLSHRNLPEHIRGAFALPQCVYKYK